MAGTGEDQPLQDEASVSNIGDARVRRSARQLRGFRGHRPDGTEDLTADSSVRESSVPSERRPGRSISAMSADDPGLDADALLEMVKRKNAAFDSPVSEPQPSDVDEILEFIDSHQSSPAREAAAVEPRGTADLGPRGSTTASRQRVRGQVRGARRPGSLAIGAVLVVVAVAIAGVVVIPRSGSAGAVKATRTSHVSQPNQKAFTAAIDSLMTLSSKGTNFATVLSRQLRSDRAAMAHKASLAHKAALAKKRRRARALTANAATSTTPTTPTPISGPTASESDVPASSSGSSSSGVSSSTSSSSSSASSAGSLGGIVGPACNPTCK